MLQFLTSKGCTLYECHFAHVCNWKVNEKACGQVHPSHTHPLLGRGSTQDHGLVQGASPPGGVLKLYMTGGSDVFFWVENLHARYFFGSSDLSRIFLGHKKRHIFLGLNSERTFCFGFPLRSADHNNIHSNFFSATCVPKKLLILRRR